MGDEVLRVVGRLFSANTREGDLLARMGGEEFLLLFDDEPPGAEDVCERLRVAVERHDWDALAVPLRVTISIGLCRAGAAEDVGELLARADAALYEAKHAGRNCLRLAS